MCGRSPGPGRANLLSDLKAGCSEGGVARPARRRPRFPKFRPEGDSRAATEATFNDFLRHSGGLAHPTVNIIGPRAMSSCRRGSSSVS
jgi:hypothetical protein